LEDCPHVPYLPYPITLEGVKDADPIELPDGRVETAAAAWDNADQWLADQLEHGAAARPDEAAKPVAQRHAIPGQRQAPAAEVCQ
jgi:hypothetical protein